jgi:hypothetical protein
MHLDLTASASRSLRRDSESQPQATLSTASVRRARLQSASASRSLRRDEIVDRAVLSLKDAGALPF